MSILKIAVNTADHHIGNTNAAVTLVEYGDFECPYCGRAHPLIKRLLEEKGNEFQFVFRNFPLRQIHPNAYIAAISAEAAGRQGKFWEMHDLLYENQDKLGMDYLYLLAKLLGLDLAQFTKDSESRVLLDKIQTDFEGGIRSGVNGTPSFFINGQKLLTYDETYESLLDAILLESEMKQH